MLHNFSNKYQYTAGKNQLESITGYKSYSYNALKAIKAAYQELNDMKVSVQPIEQTQQKAILILG